MIAPQARQALRGGMILCIWLLAPLALGLTAPLTNAGIFSLLFWQWSVFPHAITYLGPGHVQPAWSLSTAWIIASLQWLIVAAAYGWATRNRRWATQAALAPVAILATAVVVQAILHLMGYVVFQPLP